MARGNRADPSGAPGSSRATLDGTLVPPSRQRVLAALREATAPVDARELADAVGLHVTTVRFHLERLEAAGLATRAEHPGAVRQRGRPRIAYVAADPERESRSRAQLITVLAEVLATPRPETASATASVVARSEAAGRRWARALSRTTSESAGDGDPTLDHVLDELGFAPERHGGDVLLRACPFRAAARQHPEVVCAVHRGLVDHLLGPEQRARGVRLLPFMQPELCTIGVPAPPGTSGELRPGEPPGGHARSEAASDRAW